MLKIGEGVEVEMCLCVCVCVCVCVCCGGRVEEKLTWMKHYPFEGCLGEETIVLGLQGALHISTDLRTCFPVHEDIITMVVLFISFIFE